MVRRSLQGAVNRLARCFGSVRMAVRRCRRRRWPRPGALGDARRGSRWRGRRRPGRWRRRLRGAPCARIGSTSVRKARFSVCGRHQRVVRLLVPVERGAVDEQRLRVGALHLHGADHQALDRVGDVVRLVDHVGGVEARRAALSSASTSSLKTRNSRYGSIEPASRSSSPYLRVVEVEAAELAELDQPRDDHLDVDVRRVVAEVDEAEGLRAELAARQVVGAPVLHHRRVERRLVELVLDEDAPVVGQRRVDRRASTSR